MISDSEHLFHVPVGYLHIFIEELSIQVLCSHFFFFFFFVFLPYLGLLLQHIEIPRVGFAHCLVRLYIALELYEFFAHCLVRLCIAIELYEFFIWTLIPYQVYDLQIFHPFYMLSFHLYGCFLCCAKAF